MAVIKRGQNWRIEDDPNPELFHYTTSRFMNYKDVNGQWAQCNPAWTEETDQWHSLAQNIPVEAFKQVGQGVRLTMGDHGTITIKPENPNVPTVISTSEKITLEELWDNVDLEIFPTKVGFKTNYILKNSSAQTFFQWEISKTGNQLSFGQEGDLVIVYALGRPYFVFMPPFIDADRVGTLSVSYQGQRAIITATAPDLTGLAYPITIDPTGTYYPGSNVADGNLNYYNSSFTTARNATSAISINTLGTYNEIRVDTNRTTSWEIKRGAIIFDTSGLPSGAVISAASIKIYYNARSIADSALVDIQVCSFTPENAGTINDNGNYDNFGTTAFTDTPFDGDSASDQTQDLNASGIAQIVGGGESCFGFIFEADWTGTEPTGGVWDSPPVTQYYRMDSADSASDPELSITYTADTLDGYRFRNDDNDEANATWRQNEDTNDTIATDTRFRLRLQTEHMEDGEIYTLVTRKKTTSDWETVE